MRAGRRPAPRCCRRPAPARPQGSSHCAGRADRRRRHRASRFRRPPTSIFSGTGQAQNGALSIGSIGNYHLAARGAAMPRPEQARQERGNAQRARDGGSPPTAHRPAFSRRSGRAPRASRRSAGRSHARALGPPSAPRPHRNALPAKAACAPSATRAHHVEAAAHAGIEQDRWPASRPAPRSPAARRSAPAAPRSGGRRGSRPRCRRCRARSHVSASAGCMMPLSTSGFFHLSRKRAISSQVNAPPISLRAKLITSLMLAFSPA